MSKEKIKAFVEYWKETKATTKGERKHTSAFWLSLLRDLFDIEEPEKYIEFEKEVKIDGHAKLIDAYIPSTKVLIEQKDSGISLTKKYYQSGGEKLTPFEQADRYARHLNHDEHPRWIITSNFTEINVYDNNKRGNPPEIIKLEDLEKDYSRLNFLIDKKDEHIEKELQVSIQAGELVSKIYNALLKEYNDPTDEETLKSLNILSVRLVFLFYADDSGLFPIHHQFLKYMEMFRNSPYDFRSRLQELFRVLNTPQTKRDPYLRPELLAFPYVNGGLFAEENIEIPRFNEEIINLILNDASAHFDWSDISPTIFGAAFESTINPDTRRSGGMHYTSIENIHKLIDELFLDDLKQELDEIIAKDNIRGSKTRALNNYIDKLASLKFLDPACGSGNFLTETYLSLRRLENKALQELTKGQIGFIDPIKVTLDQFYGIEINDFAVSVAKTALFIAEYQTLKETELILQRNIDYLPLKSYEHIYEGNALRIDWNKIIPNYECSYIMGNPPFAGYTLQTASQKEDMSLTFKDLKGFKKFDYVTSWFKKASEYIVGTNIDVAFLTTNSIAQGESVGYLWEYLSSLGIIINFAYQSFRWNNESKEQAKVICVIIGFSAYQSKKKKKLFNDKSYALVDHINGYLIAESEEYVKARTKPLFSLRPMIRGNAPIDGGNFILSEEEANNLKKKYPELTPYIKKAIGAKENLQGKIRYCLWLLDAPIHLIKSNKEVQKRINNVKTFRENSKRENTQKKAETPHLFAEIHYKGKGDYLIFPRHSSENRRYAPVSFVKDNSIPLDSTIILNDASLFEFGLLSSNVFNAWLRVVGGRIKNDYRFSNTIVYNNFPVPENITEKDIELITKTSKNILEKREENRFDKDGNEIALGDLYDPKFMPDDLKSAHQANDKAVMRLYGFKIKMTEEECVAELMKRYIEKVQEK